MNQSRRATNEHIDIPHILGEVAEVKDIDILDLPPLGAEMDPDALIKLLNSSSETRIEFEYAGTEIRVTGTDVSVQAQ